MKSLVLRDDKNTKNRHKLVPNVGLEPTTLGLRDDKNTKNRTVFGRMGKTANKLARICRKGGKQKRGSVKNTELNRNSYMVNNQK